jgi:V/A-type H+-transporting ATPase subunit I
MNKINIIGLDVIKTDLINRIMDLGVVEISSQDSKLSDPEWVSRVKKDGNEEEVFSFDVRISQVSEVINTLDKYDTSKRPLFVTRKPLTKDEFIKALDKNNHVFENVAKVLELNKSLSELCTEENKIEAGILSLKPWCGYDIPLNMTETKYTSIIMGVIPNIVEMDELKSQLLQTNDRCLVNLIDSDKDQHYCSFICLTEEKEDILEFLKQYGFSAVTFKELRGTAADNITQYENSLKDISAKRDMVEDSIRELVTYKEEIQLFYDHLIIERDKYNILSNMLKTDTTFYIEGWIPEANKESVQEVLDEYQCWYDIKPPEEGEEFPILMNNNSFVQPFETITELYSLPSSSNIDPTVFMAPFYCAFFGLMLADLGYGAIMSILCFFVLKKFKPEGGMQRLLKVFLYCGISTAFWGVMFGSMFGDAIPAAAKLLFNSDFTIKPLWLNPMEEPMTLLIFSIRCYTFVYRYGG